MNINDIRDSPAVSEFALYLAAIAPAVPRERQWQTSSALAVHWSVLQRGSARIEPVWSRSRWRIDCVLWLPRCCCFRHPGQRPSRRTPLLHFLCVHPARVTEGAVVSIVCHPPPAPPSSVTNGKDSSLHHHLSDCCEISTRSLSNIALSTFGANQAVLSN